MVEQKTLNLLVVGSSPTRSTFSGGGGFLSSNPSDETLLMVADLSFAGRRIFAESAICIQARRKSPVLMGDNSNRRRNRECLYHSVDGVGRSLAAIRSIPRLGVPSRRLLPRSSSRLTATATVISLTRSGA